MSFVYYLLWPSQACPLREQPVSSGCYSGSQEQDNGSRCLHTACWAAECNGCPWSAQVLESAPTAIGRQSCQRRLWLPRLQQLQFQCSLVASAHWPRSAELPCSTKIWLLRFPFAIWHWLCRQNHHQSSHGMKAPQRMATEFGRQWHSKWRSAKLRILPIEEKKAKATTAMSSAATRM